VTDERPPEHVLAAFGLNAEGIARRVTALHGEESVEAR